LLESLGESRLRPPPPRRKEAHAKRGQKNGLGKGDGSSIQRKGKVDGGGGEEGKWSSPWSSPKGSVPKKLRGILLGNKENRNPLLSGKRSQHYKRRAANGRKKTDVGIRAGGAFGDTEKSLGGKGRLY